MVIDAHWTASAAAALNWLMEGPLSLAQASVHMLTTCHAPHSPHALPSTFSFNRRVRSTCVRTPKHTPPSCC